MSCAYAGSRLVFEVKHYKEKEAKDSVLAWSYLTSDVFLHRCGSHRQQFFLLAF